MAGERCRQALVAYRAKEQSVAAVKVAVVR
jgi:hypothetical protein